MKMMTRFEKKSANFGVSGEFAGRLARLKASESVRVMLLLKVEPKPATRITRSNRAESVARVKQEARGILPEIDDILRQYEGRRLAEDVDALGRITVETTAAGVKALAASEHVKTILEDQPIFSLH